MKTRNHWILRWAVSPIILLAVAGCNSGPGQVEASAMTAPTAAEASEPVPAQGEPSPTATVFSTPTETPLPSATPTPVPTPTPPPAFLLGGVISPENVNQVEVLAAYGLGTPTSMAWSPDGSNIAVRVSSGLYLLDGNTLEVKVYAPFDYSDKVVFSPDGTKLAISLLNKILVLDATSLEVVQEIRMANNARLAVNQAFTPDGKGLNVITAESQTLVMWYTTGKIYLERVNLSNGEVTTARLLAEFADLNARFSADGTKLFALVSTEDRTNMLITAWDLDSLEPQTSLAGGLDDSYRVYRDYTALRPAEAPNQIRLGRLGSEEAFTTLALDAPVLDFWFDEQGSLHVLTEEEYKRWALDQYDSPQVTFPAANTLLREIGVYHIVRGQAAVMGHYGLLSLLDTASGAVVASLDGYYGFINDMTLGTSSPVGAVSRLVDNDRRYIDILNLESLTLQARLDAVFSRNTEVVLFNQDAMVAVAERGSLSMDVWDARSGLKVDAWEAPSPIHAVAASPDGTRLALNLEDRWMVLDANTKEIIFEKTETPAEAMSAEARQVADVFPVEPRSKNYNKDAAWGNGGAWVGFSDGAYAVVWDVATGTVVRVFEGVYSLDMAANGTVLGGMMTNRTTNNFWDAGTGQLAFSLSNASVIGELQFFPSGEIVMVYDDKGILNIYQVDTGELIHSFEQFNVDFEVSGDGRMVITRDYSGVITIWGIKGE